MATTGFWPVKGRLKDVLDYAENPDKTIDRRYLDDDLAQALRYVENPEKTDQQMYVSAINCRVVDAYAQMQETKRRYGKEGRNIAYHGYQSFRPGEVTPEECHQIGLETAREMWGDYEVVVTTHLNTDSLHNHFVVNSVSCKTGLKYHNHRKDHYRLREISDNICVEHGLSVIQNARFYGGEKGAYWVHKSGRRTHRDILKEDIEYCLSIAGSWEQFEQQLRGLGYTIDWQRFSVKAKDWERAVRLDRMGYSKEGIRQRLVSNINSNRFYVVWNSNLPYRPKDLSDGIDIEGSNITVSELVDLYMGLKRKLHGKKPPHVSPHVLRHTFCTNMQQAGIDVKSLQYLMGHSHASVTLDVYTHTDYNAVERAFHKAAASM